MQNRELGAGNESGGGGGEERQLWLSGQTMEIDRIKLSEVSMVFPDIEYVSGSTMVCPDP